MLNNLDNKNKPAVYVHGSLIAKNTILNLLGLAIPMLIGIITIPLVIKWLGVERFGVLSLIWVVFGYFGILDLGLGRATIKFVAEALGKDRVDDVPKYLWTSVIFQGTLGLVGSVVVILLAPILAEKILNIPSSFVNEAKNAFLLLAISLPIVLISATFQGMLEASQRFDLINAVKIPTSTVNYILPLLGVFLGFGLPGIVALLVTSRFIILLIWILICLKIFPILKSRFSFYKEAARPLLSFGGWLTVTNVLWPILANIDRFLIGSLHTIEAVGYYTAPYEIVIRLGIIPSSLTMTLFPAFSTLGRGNNHDMTRALFSRSIKYILLVIGPVVILTILFADKIMKLWLGEDFALNSTIVFQILLATFLVSSMAWVPSVFLQGIGEVHYTAKFLLVELCIYLPFAWLFISWWGINGAALAWALRGVVDVILLFGTSGKVGGIGFSCFLKNGVFRLVVALSLFALIGFILSSFSWKIYGLIMLTFCFLLVTWFYVLDRSEKIWVKEGFHFIFTKR